MADVALFDARTLAAASAGIGQSIAVDLGAGRSAVKAQLRVLAANGVLKWAIETSPDGETGWRVARSLPRTRPSAAGVITAWVDELERWVRFTWTVEVTATFAITVEAHQLYGDAQDLFGKMSAELLERIEVKQPGARARALIAASAEMESALATHYPLPLTSVPEIVRDKAADMAAFRLLVRNGFVGGGIDELVSKANDNAIAWLKLVRERKALPFGALPAASPAVHVSTGNPLYPDVAGKRFSNNWGDF